MSPSASPPNPPPKKLNAAGCSFSYLSHMHVYNTRMNLSHSGYPESSTNLSTVELWEKHKLLLFTGLTLWKMGSAKCFVREYDNWILFYKLFHKWDLYYTPGFYIDLCYYMLSLNSKGLVSFDRSPFIFICHIVQRHLACVTVIFHLVCHLLTLIFSPITVPPFQQNRGLIWVYLSTIYLEGKKGIMELYSASLLSAFLSSSQLL